MTKIEIRSRDATSHPSYGGAAAGNRHCEERSDEAIQVGILDWIASLTLAMTIRFRDAPEHSNHAK